MAVITNSISNHAPRQLRPFDVVRDMEAVADLIESCFSTTLDPDGRRYIRQMRSAAQKRGFDRWASLANTKNSFYLNGFVWEEGGVVVGNLSLVPFFFQGHRIFMIANVAVHSDYRRRGIAQALTTAALERCRQRRARATWLQVRHDNQAALDLYLKRGFFPQARRTTWIANLESLQGDSLQGASIEPRRLQHWSKQRLWLDQNYPPHLRWHFPISFSALQPGIWSLITRFFNEVDIRHWAVECDHELQGVLSWQGSRRYTDNLWLASLPENDDLVVGVVMPFINRERLLRKPISLNYPEGRAVDTLLKAGLKQKATLIWMEVKHEY